MHLQIASLNKCKVALDTLVWFLSRVCFQMSSKIAIIDRCIVTLVAFVGFLSRMGFQMHLQTACSNRCEVTLVASVRLYSRVNFQMCPYACSVGWFKATLVAFVCLLSLFLSHTTGKSFIREITAHSCIQLLTVSFCSRIVGCFLMEKTFTFPKLIHCDIDNLNKKDDNPWQIWTILVGLCWRKYIRTFFVILNPCYKFWF